MWLYRQTLIFSPPSQTVCPPSLSSDCIYAELNGHYTAEESYSYK